ncbi:MAG: hypothetical protein A2474_04210 [Elusimicrobia bacterium RIFOXYC2_FULL_34_12]|nr:MAG: hypothetical protein A2474_04210 [Elusimicrobia bacterium RIFOXYC2_FULL_34_12]OGS38093.1 MAG: hypothetical protein A2551_02660 [Elusimicrobia bacterium RIFOXYD2_FULL_34_30]HAM39434.1 hypothetical protein [Elusimicrobiota bacterium]
MVFLLGATSKKTRALIKYAVKKSNLIKSSTANPSGFWLSNNKKEILKNIESFKNRACRTLESAVRLKDTWNSINPKDPIK